MDQDLAELHRIIVQLRAPDGCPWDREQTPHSLRRYLLEESYEVVESIDSDSPADVAEELGDVMMLVTMLATMYEERGDFSVSDVLRGVCAKLVRRHPHVFGDASVASTAEVLEQWQRIKVEQEGKTPHVGVLSGVSQSLPALERAYKLQRKAAKVGFDWPTLGGVREKLHEEIDETIQAAAEDIGGDNAGVLAASRRADDSASAHLEEEVGDMLFAAINLARYLGVDPSLALNAANTKFTKRFKHVEQRMKESGLGMKPAAPEAMDRYWNEAKVKP